jgi:hypothetical protein
MSDARAVHGERLAAWHARLERLECWGRVATRARVAGALAGAAALAAAAQLGTDPRWLLAAVAALVIAEVARALLAWREETTRRAVRHHEAALERLAGTGFAPSARDDAAPEHPYAHEIDLVGARSLIGRIDTTVTGPGGAKLASWLLAAATPGEIRSRHEAIDELRDDVLLREAIALAAGPAAADVRSPALLAWAEGPTFFPWRWLDGVLRAVPAAVAVSAAGWIAGVWDAAPLGLAILAAFAAHAILRRRIAAVLAAGGAMAADLAALGAVMRLLETRRFAAPLLRDAQRALVNGGTASRGMAALARSLSRAALARHELAAPFAYALAIPARNAVAVERWRERHGIRLREWAEALGTLDAVAAVAAYAYENPEDPFPEIVDGTAPVFDAKGLGHPLLSADRCVRNDVTLGGDAPALLVVSGSNMSGKSTLLRSVGLNVVLALAGAPVRARGLRLSPFGVVATIRSRDALAEGVSRFQWEASRLSAMLERARGRHPVLFLVDELLHGTNSADRLAGARAVLTALLDAGAVGLCTTHDLALAAVAEELAPRAANVHFRDVLDGGGLRFDHRLRPGPVTCSNALALLRAAGLPL